MKAIIDRCRLPVKSTFRSFMGEKITYRDRQTYFGVLYDGKATRWICHLRFDDNRKSIEIPLGERSFTKSWKDTGKFSIDRLEDINRHANQPKAVVRNYLSGCSIR